MLDGGTGRVLFVDGDASGLHDGSTWQNAFLRVQDALAAAVNGDEIRVAQGVYTPAGPGGSRAATFRLASGVVLRGGYAGWGTPDPDAHDVSAFRTILSGDLNGNDGSDFLNNQENSYHVVTGSGANATALLDGFEIVGGNANAGSFGNSTTAGGGVYCDAGSPTIVHCTIRGNYASWEGGGIFNQRSSSPTLTHSTIIGNESNGGGGMFNRDGSNPTLINCLVANNTCPSYGGGGIGQLSSSVTLANCTFYGNSAMYAGPAIYSVDWRSTVTASNCIFWDNVATAHPGGSPISSEATIAFSCVQDADPNDATVQPGEGNFDDDPRFVEPLGADNQTGTGDENLRLRPDSPCINAGNNAAVPGALTIDLDGDVRIAGGQVDMGGYEGPHQALVLSTRAVTIDEGGTVALSVALALDPSGPVNVTVARSSGDTDVGVTAGGLLMFNSTNYATPQTVTLAAGPDADWLNGPALVGFTAPGFTSAAVSVIEWDGDVPPVLYVDRSATGNGTGENWANAYTDLQQAFGLAAMQPQVQEIRVAEGTYRPAAADGSRQATFRLVDRVAVYGGFPAGGGAWDQRDPAAHPTTLSGDLNANDAPIANVQQMLSAPTRQDNAYHVVTASGCTEAAILDGFTVSGGNANGQYPDTYGGGIHTGRLTMRNLTVTGNAAKDSAGGIDAAGVLSQCVVRGNASEGSCGGLAGYDSTLEDCTIADNWAAYSGGGMSAGSALVINCAFTGNRAQNGAAASNDSGSPAFVGCTFLDNAAEQEGGALWSWEARPSLTDCTFTGNTAGKGGALALGSTDGTITGCRFFANQAGISGEEPVYGSGGAVANWGYSDPTLVNCLFSGNTATGSGGAVFNEQGSVPQVVNCTFSANTAGDHGGGLAVGDDYGSRPVVTNCVFWGNRDSSGMTEQSQVFGHSEETGMPVVNYSCVQGWTGVLEGNGNTGADPRLVDADGSDNVAGTEDDNLRMLRGSVAIDAGSNAAVPASIVIDLAGNPRFVDDLTTPDTGSGTPPLVDMGAYEYRGPRTFYVDDDASAGGDGSLWTRAMRYLQDALELAAPGDEIHVAQGFYRPDQGAGRTPGDREATFQLLNGVAVRGAYAGIGGADPDARDTAAYRTVLSGDLTGNDLAADLMSWGETSRSENSYTVVTGSGTGQTAVLDGVTITGGRSNGAVADYYTPPGDFAWIAGGGMYNDSGSPTLIDCTFYRNSTCSSFRSYPAGTGGGGMCNVNSSPTLIGCRFEENAAVGADASSAGGGMYNLNSHPTLTNCVFRDNIATGYDAEYYGGGIANVDSSSTLVGCLITGNWSHAGSGVWNYGQSASSLVNCTVVGNWAYHHAGGIATEGTGLTTLSNCVLWANVSDVTPQDEQSQQIAGGTLVINNACVQGWTGSLGGTANTGADPRFVDPGHWDDRGTPEGSYDDDWVPGAYQLRSDSPCVNTGDNAAVPLALTTDLDGNPRIIAGTVDMGVYEFQEAVTPGVIYVDAAASGANSGTSWTDAFTDLQDALEAADAGCEVWVAHGTYRPAGPGGGRAASFQVDEGVVVKGGFAGLGALNPDMRDTNQFETVLSGDLNGDDAPGFVNRGDNTYHVVTGGEDAAVLDGVTIAGGYADGQWPYPESFGGGLYQFLGTVSNCVIRDNAAIDGGGLYRCSGEYVRCVIADNLAFRRGGGASLDGEHPTFTSCVFRGNVARPDGEDGRGGGMFTLDNSPDLINCVFAGNVGSMGGALYVMENYGSEVVNCVFVGNRATSWAGGGLFNDGQGLEGSPWLTNCIFWANTAGHEADELAQIAGDAMTINYSCVQGWTGQQGGTGNIGSAPQFVDADGGDDAVGTADDDLRLLVLSPCIDAGDNTAVPPGVATDLAGNPRIIGGVVDIGAHEFAVTWNGQGDGDWEDGSQWQGAPSSGPDGTSHVVIGAAHTVVVNSPQEANSLTVCNGGGVLIAAGASLTITSDAAVSGGGRLEVAPGASLACGGTLTVAGGGLAPSQQEPQGDGPTVQGESEIGLSTIAAASFDLRAGEVSVGLAGPGGLRKSTAGTVVLGGMNTYAGGTTVTEGVLLIENARALPAGGALTITGGTVVLGAGLNAARGVAGAVAAAIAVNDAAPATAAAILEGAGSVAMPESASFTPLVTPLSASHSVTARRSGCGNAKCRLSPATPPQDEPILRAKPVMNGLATLRIFEQWDGSARPRQKITLRPSTVDAIMAVCR